MCLCGVSMCMCVYHDIIYVCASVRVCKCTCVCMHVYVCMCMCVSRYACVCLCVRPCAYVWVYTLYLFKFVFL